MTSQFSTLYDVVKAALGETDVLPRDAGVAALALKYATEIDSGEGDLTKLGPSLLSAMEALQMSPRARAAAQKGAGGGKSGSPKLDELRERRRARAGRASDTHAASS